VARNTLVAGSEISESSMPQGVSRHISRCHGKFGLLGRHCRQVEEEDLLRLRGASSVSSRQQTINVTDSNVTGIKISRISIYIQDNRYAYMERKSIQKQKLKNTSILLFTCLSRLCTASYGISFPKGKRVSNGFLLE